VSRIAKLDILRSTHRIPRLYKNVNHPLLYVRVYLWTLREDNVQQGRHKTRIGND
jgi:hypothetical protein